jgi:hypothetical protein
MQFDLTPGEHRDAQFRRALRFGARIASLGSIGPLATC